MTLMTLMEIFYSVGYIVTPVRGDNIFMIHWIIHLIDLCKTLMFYYPDFVLALFGTKTNKVIWI